MSISTDSENTDDTDSYCLKGFVLSVPGKWAKEGGASPINTAHEYREGANPKALCGPWGGMWAAERNSLVQTLCPERQKQGEDKALTLPNNSSHPVNTKIVTKHCTPNDPSVNHQQATTLSSWTVRLEESKRCRTDGGSWNAGGGNYSGEAKPSHPLLV